MVAATKEVMAKIILQVEELLQMPSMRKRAKSVVQVGERQVLLKIKLAQVLQDLSAQVLQDLSDSLLDVHREDQKGESVDCLAVPTAQQQDLEMPLSNILQDFSETLLDWVDSNPASLVTVNVRISAKAQRGESAVCLVCHHPFLRHQVGPDQQDHPKVK